MAKGWWPQIVRVPGLPPKVGFRETTLAEWEGIGAYAVESMTSIAGLIMDDCSANARTFGKDDLPTEWDVTVPTDGVAASAGGGLEKFCAPTWGHYGFTQK